MSVAVPALARARLVAVLAVSQVIGWGTTFDMPGVMGRSMAPDVGLSLSASFFGLTLMMLVGGLAGPAIGEAIRRHGAARVLAADYGFRAALQSSDRDTVVSALENHGSRIGARQMLLIGLDGQLVAAHPPGAGVQPGGLGAGGHDRGAAGDGGPGLQLHRAGQHLCGCRCRRRRLRAR